MQEKSNCRVVNIRDYLDSDDPMLGENFLREMISRFSCPKNPEVERFLKQQAIDFAKKQQAITYLLLPPKGDLLLGYFSLTIKPLVVNTEPFSNTMRKKMARFSDVNGSEHNYNMAAYLIAQLGKNFDEKALGRITGEEVLGLAVKELKAVQYSVGGMVSFVETDNNKKLLSFYENHGYKRFNTRMTTTDNPRELVQLLTLI